MSQQEMKLIEAIKSKPNHQVFFGYQSASIKVAITTKNCVKQQSVWLGRPSTVKALQDILAA